MAKIISDSNGNSYVIGEYIDKGSFSQVYKLECCTSKRQFAGKFVSKEKLFKFGIGHKVWDEIKIHRLLNHKNIVQFYTHIERESHIIIVLEYCSKYSMVNILHALKTLSANEAKFFMVQIMSAVGYLHQQHIVHRDLKLGNLFVNKCLEIKLGDFGLAVVIEHEGQKRFSRCGTPNYISPEVINGVGHSYEVDVWALGCILYTMLEGVPPFQGKDTTTTYSNILRCTCNFSSRIPSTARIFINTCLQKEPKDRPSVFELMKCEFIASKSIQPQAPQLNFEEGKRLSSNALKKRKITDLWEPQRPRFEEFVFNHLEKLLKFLDDVNRWSVSKFGEFLAESSAKIQLIWVNSWMDFTNLYGFAYQLNNNNFGMIFNDGTRMLFKMKERCIHYVPKIGAIFVCNENTVPNSLKKKMKILVNCWKYMNESLRDAHNAKFLDSKHQNFTCEVFYWTRGADETVMFLTNGSVQINFTSDHTKVIICGLTKTVTVIERVDYMKTLKLNVLEKCGCSNELRRKLAISSEYIKGFLAERSES